MRHRRILSLLCALAAVYLGWYAPAPEPSGAFATQDLGLTDWEVSTYVGVLENVYCDGMSLELALAIRGLSECDWRRMDREMFLAIQAYEEQNALELLAKIDGRIASLKDRTARMDAEERDRAERELAVLAGYRDTVARERAGRPYLRRKDLQSARIIRDWLPELQLGGRESERRRSDPASDGPQTAPAPSSGRPSSV